MKLMIKHGHNRRVVKRTKEYTAWIHMLQRCRNPNNHAYKNYGGRGITVCDKWLSFENFIADVGLSPSANHSLDRYPDNNGSYEPGNVRWATFKEQNLNKRNSIKIPISEIAKQFNINVRTLKSRLQNGWDLKTALSVPPQDKGYKLVKQNR